MTVTYPVFTCNAKYGQKSLKYLFFIEGNDDEIIIKKRKDYLKIILN